MLRYQDIVNSLPLNFQDYIRSSDEWIALLNQCVRRATMNSRRFNTLRTNAPIPLDITSQPLLRRDEGLSTYEDTYMLSESYSDAMSSSHSEDWSVVNGIREWTNKVRYLDIFPADIQTNNFTRFTFYRSSFLNQGFTNEDFDSLQGLDTVLLIKFADNVEYVPCKFVKKEYDSEAISDYYSYRVNPVYLSPLGQSANVIEYKMYFGCDGNKEYDYYWTPQHSIDAIYSRGDIGDIEPIIQFNAANVQFNVTNWIGGDLTNAMLRVLQASVEWENAESFAIPLTSISAGLLFGTSVLNYAGIATGRDIRILVTYGLVGGIVDKSEEFPLNEICMIDPILFNVVRLECKKALYEFIEDTTAAGMQIMQELNNEIKEELKKVAKTIRTPISKPNEQIGAISSNKMFLMAR